MSAPLLAPDAAVPHRDALLEGEVVRRLLAAERCDRVDAKYRVGHSLRVVYAVQRGGRREHVTGRTFAGGTSGAAFARACDASQEALPAVVHAPGLDAVLWTFPNDRRLTALSLLAGPSEALDRLVGQPVARTRLVAYAAEQSASAQCLDSGGRVVAYAKVHRGDGAVLEQRSLERVGRALTPADTDLRVPRVLGAGESALAVEPLEGRRLDGLDHVTLTPAMARLGAALAALHAVRPLPEARFERLDAPRLATAAEVISRARPSDAHAAEDLLAALLAHDAGTDPAVHLHGDANLRNALLADGRVALIDLEHAAAGPAAADLGQVLAGLLVARVLGRLTEPAQAALSAALLSGYGERAVAPDSRSLRWHTAASVLARGALPAVSRVRPLMLRHVGGALAAARELA